MSKQLRELAEGDVITVPLFNDGQQYQIGERDGADCLITNLETGKELIAPVQLQGDPVEQEGQ